MTSERVGINKRIAERLRKDGRIDETSFKRAVAYAQRKAVRVEEALIELEILEETMLLKYIATIHKTQFVSTERMSKAKLDRDALKLVPKGMARHMGIFPLVLDRVNDKLIIATADPDNLAAIDELQIASGVQRVVALVARPEAVTAAIDRGYEGDRTRFKQLMQPKTGDIAEMIFQPATSAERAQRGTPRHAADWSENISPRERRARPATGEFAPPGRPRGGHAEPPPRRRTGRGSQRGRSRDRPVTGRRREPPPQRRPHRPGADEPWLDDYERDYSRGDYDHGDYDPYDEGYDYGDAPRDEYRASSRRRTGRFDDDPEVDRRRRPRRRTADVPPPGRRTGRGYHGDPDEIPPLPRSSDALADAPLERDGSDRGRNAPRPLHADYDPIPAAAPSPRGYPGDFDLAFEEGGDKESHARPELAEKPAPIPRTSSMFPRPIGGLGFGPRSTRKEQSPLTTDVFGSVAFSESLRVMVGLLENNREDLRGHSTFVARLAANICERISLPKEQQDHIVIASYLHDIGKMTGHHLTALNVAQLEPCLQAAEKLAKLPEQLMESVGLPEPVIQAVSSMYERMTGDGIPEGMAGKDIPIGARILAVADSYADLTRNARNAYDQIMTADEAISILRQHAGTVFDANVIEVLEKAMGGEKILTDLLENRHRFLIVDPDPEETMVLQLRLVDQGFDVHIARSSGEAKTALDAREFALVLSEIDLEMKEAGFTLHREVTPSRPGMAWVFISSRDDRQIAERVFKLGVDDFIAKPVSTEILVAKLTKLLDKKPGREAPRGVAGSLSQMALTDIVQILWHGRKTCSLNLTQGEATGAIHFQDGMIVNAFWGDADGEVAFYRLLTLGEDGEFAVDPEFVPEGEPAIQATPEALLLEGMRLLDEGAIP